MSITNGSIFGRTTTTSLLNPQDGSGWGEAQFKAELKVLQLLKKNLPRVEKMTALFISQVCSPNSWSLVVYESQQDEEGRSLCHDSLNTTRCSDLHFSCCCGRVLQTWVFSPSLLLNCGSSSIRQPVTA